MTKHWYLLDALFSAHTWHVNLTLRRSDSTLYVSTSSDGGGPYSGNFVQYPGGRGRHPRIYAADRKHANYPTTTYCNGPGGMGGADGCTSPRTEVRLEVNYAQNIGRRGAPFIDCVPTGVSSHPAYGLGREECYWTQRNFRGWFSAAAGGGSAASYSDLLTDHFGF